MIHAEQFDEVSAILEVDTATSLEAIEKFLRGRNHTMGAHPNDSRSLADWIAAGMPGRNSKDNDPVRQLFSGLEATLVDGTKIKAKAAPRRAVGPDLLGAVLESNGKLGRCTRAWIASEKYAGGRLIRFKFENAARAENALAQMRGLGVRPASSDIVTTNRASELALTLPENRLGAAAELVAVRCALAQGGIKAPT